MANSMGEAGSPLAVVEEVEETAREAEEAPELSAALSALLPGVGEHASAAAELSRAAQVTARTARVVGVSGHTATITLRGLARPIEAVIAPEVDPELVREAREAGQSVLVELAPGEPPLVVGVVQTRIPREIRLKAAKILIEADDEVLVRSGHGAVRIRNDGDIEMVGSRISAASRGLFRIVGRMLRLN